MKLFVIIGLLFLSFNTSANKVDPGIFLKNEIEEIIAFDSNKFDKNKKTIEFLDSSIYGLGSIKSILGSNISKKATNEQKKLFKYWARAYLIQSLYKGVSENIQKGYKIEKTLVSKSGKLAKVKYVNNNKADNLEMLFKFKRRKNGAWTLMSIEPNEQEVNYFIRQNLKNELRNKFRNERLDNYPYDEVILFVKSLVTHKVIHEIINP